MNISRIKYNDISNGFGVRTSVFISGCERHCPGCFNPETWNYDNGEPLTQDLVEEIIQSLSPEYIDGISILGGEPLSERNFWSTIGLLSEIKQRSPRSTVWLFTSYKFEDLRRDGYMCILDKYVDVLKDGEFIEAEKDVGLLFRGSRNQRLIDIKETYRQCQIVELKGRLE